MPKTRLCQSQDHTEIVHLVQSLQSSENATSSQPGSRMSNVGAKSLLDAGPRSSGVSSDTAYLAQNSQQGTPSRFYQGTEGSCMSLQSLQSSLADEPMTAASNAKYSQRLSQDAQPVATAAEQRYGTPHTWQSLCTS